MTVVTSARSRWRCFRPESLRSLLWTDTARIVLLALIGWAVSYGCGAGMIASVAMPALIAWQSRRRTAHLAALAYFAASLWAVLPSAYKFLGHRPLPAAALFAAGVLIVTGLWGRCWGPDRRPGAVRIVAVLVAATVPPFGIIGLASPLSAAGLLFPGTGLAGLVLLTLTAARLAKRPTFTVATVAAVSLCTHLASVPRSAVPEGWTALNTRLSEPVNLLEEYRQHQYLKAQIQQSSAQVLVLPENVISNWTEATDEFWADTFDALGRSGRMVVIGATTPRSASGAYRNVLVLRGAERGVLDQRVPVPVGMLDLVGAGGVPLNLTGPPTIRVRDRRTGVLICYEQLLPWTLITAFGASPDVVIAVSNLRGVEANPVEAQQRATLQAWARLYAVPVVAAVNR